MANYLYGLSIHKIQEFIFETGKLKEIIGASQLVEEICSDRFEKAFVGSTYKPENAIVKAAGKIVYLFENDEDTCLSIVKSYISDILREIPGLNITQALVKFEGHPQEEHFMKLEERLTIQKSKPNESHMPGWMAFERSRRTGNPAIPHDLGYDYLDRRQVAKWNCELNNRGALLKYLVGDLEFTSAHNADLSNLVEDIDKSWIAVVHADGNNLGKIIQEITHKVSKTHPDKLSSLLSQFSYKLDVATKLAAKEAYQRAIGSSNLNAPIRPVILGGDDLTIIVRGDLALPFTFHYLKCFEKHTCEGFLELANYFSLQNELGKGLTACAGLAYVKVSYPLHYALNLAESLCAYSKNISKNQTGNSSCLSFHRVQSSFVEEYEVIVDRELTIHDRATNASMVQLNNGPYFIHPQTGFDSVRDLTDWIHLLNQEDAPKGSLRAWLTELKLNLASAEQLMGRIRTLNVKYDVSLKLNQAVFDRNGKKTTHLYDALSISNL